MPVFFNDFLLLKILFSGVLSHQIILNKRSFIAFGMKLLFFIVALIATAFAQITNIEDCKCNSGFEAKLSHYPGEPNRSYQCHGILLRIIVPCNVVKKPECVCTEATGITTTKVVFGVLNTATVKN
ncbi:hypothetical protein JTB14_020857 [Gonioctena quinquepunctata]|nr:hypothetical protein JTB14_020857 [Gonioctena quinquepunctata]